MIEFDDVTHRYEHAIAVQGISLRIEAGVTTALIGPSGCGKSTLLKLIVGLEWPERGRVTVQGNVISPLTINKVRHRVGYVIQSGGLFPHLTARDNVTLAARYLDRDPHAIEARVRELVELVQLSQQVLDRHPGDLSGGQRQRVSLMRALMLDPDILLFDEPLGALDPMVRHGLQDELRDLFARLKKTVVLVTHDLAEAAFFAETIVLMREGQIVQQGSYRNLIDAPADDFVLAFLRAQRAFADSVHA